MVKVVTDEAFSEDSSLKSCGVNLVTITGVSRICFTKIQAESSMFEC